MLWACSSDVALLAEGVDRNLLCLVRSSQIWHVALLAEGVDRNQPLPESTLGRQVALLAEGVDRNPN